MKTPQLSRISAAMARAFAQIGADETWCTGGVYVERLVVTALPESIKRPAIIIREGEFADFANEAGATLEIGVGDYSVTCYLVSSVRGYGADVADEINGMCEDAVRAVFADPQLSIDDPDEPTLAQFIRTATFEFDEEFTVGSQIAVGKLTFTGRIDFQKPA